MKDFCNLNDPQFRKQPSYTCKRIEMRFPVNQMTYSFLVPLCSEPNQGLCVGILVTYIVSPLIPIKLLITEKRMAGECLGRPDYRPDTENEDLHRDTTATRIITGGQGHSVRGTRWVVWKYGFRNRFVHLVWHEIETVINRLVSLQYLVFL